MTTGIRERTITAPLVTLGDLVKGWDGFRPEPADEDYRAVAAEMRCPRCRCQALEALAFRKRDEDGWSTLRVAFRCTACGHAEEA